MRVAETVWMEGVFLKDYPPEAYTIKCLEVNILLSSLVIHHPKNHHPKNHCPENHHPKNDHAQDSLALLATEGGQQRFEKHLKSWMKKIQANIYSDNYR